MTNSDPADMKPTTPESASQTPEMRQHSQFANFEREFRIADFLAQPQAFPPDVVFVDKAEAEAELQRLSLACEQLQQKIERIKQGTDYDELEDKLEAAEARLREAEQMSAEQYPLLARRCEQLREAQNVLVNEKRDIETERDTLRTALAALADQHDTLWLSNGPCVCEPHVKARALLTPDPAKEP